MPRLDGVDGRLDDAAPRPRTHLYEAMLSRARELFSRQGYHGTSIREITALAGSSEALVYRHFGSKQELYRRAVLQEFDQIVRTHLAEPPTDAAGGYAGAVEVEIGRLYDMFARNAGLLRSLIGTSTLENDPAAMITAGGSPLRPVFDRLEHVLRSAPSLELLTHIDVPVAVRVCVGFAMSVSLFDRWLFDEQQPPPARGYAVAELTALVLYGCTTRPGTGRVHSHLPPPAAVPGAEPPGPDGPERVRVRPDQRKRRSRHEVRRLILDAARELFSTTGFDGTSTKAVATRAGVSETSVYRHFGTKSSLFESAVFGPFESWVGAYLQRWGAEVRSQQSLEDQTRDYVSTTYDMLSENGAVMRSALGSLNDDKDAAQSSASLLHQNFVRLEYQLAAIAAENDVVDIDPVLVIRPTFGMLYALSATPEWMFDGPSDRPVRARLIDEITSIMVYGLTGRPAGAGQST
jgi:AcrR family transcriptional regulator